jgi:hypothetical protein
MWGRQRIVVGRYDAYDITMSASPPSCGRGDRIGILKTSGTDGCNLASSG